MAKRTHQKKAYGDRSSAEKDQRVSGCAICKRLIFSWQDYVWTRYVGYVHKEECLERLNDEHRIRAE